MEEWREIPDFPGYEISNMGNVRGYNVGSGTKIKPHILTPQKWKHKLTISLYRKRKNYKRKIINLMVEAWLPENKGKMPYHINGDAWDCRLENIGISNKPMFCDSYRGKPVAKIDKDGNIVKLYPTVQAAAEDNYMSMTAMSNRCNGVFNRFPKIVDGYTYRFYKELELENGDT